MGLSNSPTAFATILNLLFCSEIIKYRNIPTIIAVFVPGVKSAERKNNITTIPIIHWTKLSRFFLVLF